MPSIQWYEPAPTIAAESPEDSKRQAHPQAQRASAGVYTDADCPCKHDGNNVCNEHFRHEQVEANKKALLLYGEKTSQVVKVCTSATVLRQA